MTTPTGEDLRALTPRQLDALREVANMGAGHAATALSTMTGQQIMISVPRLTVAALDEIPNQIAAPEEPVAAVLMRMEGDLTGLTLLVFPHPIALRVAGLMMRKTVTALGAIEESAIREAGNILSAAYLNALADFMGMTLLPSPPSLAVDMSDAVLSSTYVESAQGATHLMCVESEFHLQEAQERLRGFFLLLPDPASLRRILQTIRVA
ncbi:MAG: chemotaxis protein CheC [Gemmatimonadetes bacterium]|nr:chemotaxis protein CheC [Gemmatimonadota bacterium]MBP7549436.1 chemotaxis protein CheC [Gemmatimonadaceae bacterium]